MDTERQGIANSALFMITASTHEIWDAVKALQSIGVLNVDEVQQVKTKAHEILKIAHSKITALEGSQS